MEFIATSIALQNEPVLTTIWGHIETNLDTLEGVCYYKSPQLKFSFADTPEIILITKKYGIFIIKIFHQTAIETFDSEGEYWRLENGDTVYNPDIILHDYATNIENKLVEDHRLRISRSNKRSKVPVHEILVLPWVRDHDSVHSNLNIESFIVGSEYADCILWSEQFLLKVFEKFSETNQAVYSVFCSEKDSLWAFTLPRLEGTSGVKKKQKYEVISAPKTKGDLLKKTRDIIFLLDKEQRQVAKQIPNGPQRVRGLAGTGKTVVLAMKAAIMHAQFPNKKILFTFFTRSMYSQIISLIELFYQEEGCEESPDWNNLHVRHTWGATDQQGVYRDLCNHSHMRFIPLTEAVRGNADDPFRYVCSDALESVQTKKVDINDTTKYDMVLIDEAQDLPVEFFQLIYELTNEPKRIIWAYDEFQTLNERRMPEPDELFGRKSDGTPKVDLSGNYPGKICKDFVLHNSYRNPKIISMIAHGLGMGLYRNGEIIRKVSKSEWVDYGYRVECWPPEDGKAEVIICRDDRFSLNKLEEYYLKYEFGDPLDLLTLYKYDGLDQQIDAISKLVADDINIHEMPPHDIIVVDLDARNSKNNLIKMQRALSSYDIDSVIPGVVESPSIFLPANKVTLTTVRRAKGNEAASVYIVNSQKAFESSSYKALISTLINRNTLFTAITRAQGWCHLAGYGPGMDTLEVEIKKVKAQYPKFVFPYSTEDDLMTKIGFSGKSKKELEEIEDLLKKFEKHKDVLAALGITLKASGQ